MKINAEHFRVRPGKAVKLSEWPTAVKPMFKSKHEYEKLLEKHVEELSSLRRLHYASNRYAVLLIFQGMDSASKDGAIRHVMSGVNPQGCQVFSFKQPSPEELDHDFLRRTTRRLPERGRIGIFNRSYYEEVLIVRVYPEILRGQGLPDELLDEKTIWPGRYRSIVEFSLADVQERTFWPRYTQDYEACLSATSTKTAPWYVVPADDKENARLIVSHIVLAAFKRLKMAFPTTTAGRRCELKSIRRKLRRERHDRTPPCNSIQSAVERDRQEIR